MVTITGLNVSGPTKIYTYKSEGSNSKHMLKIKEEKEGEDKTRNFSINNKELGSKKILFEDKNIIAIGKNKLKLKNGNNLNHLKKILGI